MRNFTRKKHLSSRKKRTIRGGKRIGRGVSGIVYTPVLHCNDNSHTRFSGQTYVSKIIPGHTIESQTLYAAKIREIDPLGNFTIVPEHVCSLNIKQSNVNYKRNKNDPQNIYQNNNTRNGTRKIYTHQIIYKNGGKSVESLLKNRANHVNIIRALKAFIPHLQKFNETYIHFDLHLDNLVFDGTHIRMIDFEKIEELSTPSHKTIDLCNLLSNLYNNLNKYSQKETCDTTYVSWLEKYKEIATVPACRSTATVEQLVECFRELPAVTKSSGCAIMGGSSHLI